MAHLSVVPMSLLTIAGPMDQFDAVVASCVINQEFHPESALRLMEGVEGLRPFPLSNPYAPVLRRGDDLAGRAEIPLAYAQFEECSLEDLSAYFDQLSERLDQLDQERDQALRTAEESRAVAHQLEDLRGIGTTLEELWGLDFVRFRHGYFPRAAYDSFQQTLNKDENILFIPTSIGPQRVYGAYFTTKQAHQRVDTLFNSLHFTRVHIDAQADGTPEQAIEQLNQRAQQADQQAQQVLERRAALREEEGPRLLAACAYLRYHNDVYDMRRYAAHSRETFYLMGWVPKDCLADFQTRTAAFDRLSCVVDDADEVAAKPPTKLKNSFFGRVFRPFLEMYGLPAYNELDPSLFMAASYCLFFGIMFGDVGQGLGLALIGLILARWKKMWLGNIITCCGLAGALGGCVYGSVFGFEDILPGFKIMEESTLLPGSSNVLILLLLSVALGIFMLTLVMVLNIVNGIRQRNFVKILFGPNGVVGIVFYLGVIVAALAALVFGVDLFIPAYVLPVLILPLVLILMKEPLSKLLSGDPDWKHFEVGEVFGTGFFELFETLLSYLTNTLSFMRVGAYAITHVGLMMVIQMLAGSGLNPVVIVLGNLFVMGFEGLLVGIQVLRLEFYELFGRFYDDGGIPYTPKIIDYSTREGA